MTRNLNGSPCSVRLIALCSDYDWKSGKYSTWTESRWDNFKVRVFLIPSKQFEVRAFILSFCSCCLSPPPSLPLPLSLSFSFHIVNWNEVYYLYSTLYVFDLHLYDFYMNWFGGGCRGGGRIVFLQSLKSTSLRPVNLLAVLSSLFSL